MEFRDRLTAVLKGRAADRIPFAPYDSTVPRGTFSRELRNRGMGLLCKRETIESTTPNVTAEVTDEESGISRTFYHTPMGTVSTGFATQRYRFQKKYLIEKREDFTPAIFMVNDTRFHHDDDFYHTETRHLGQDGLVRGNGPEPPYEASEFFFGLETWSYVQYDYPDEFHALLEALEAREVRRIECLLESPAWLVSFGSLSGSYSPALYEKYALPFYRKYVPMLQDRGKACVLHAHNSNITVFSSLIKQTGVKVVEAFTPPPVGDLTLREAREIWGSRHRDLGELSGDDLLFRGGCRPSIHNESPAKRPQSRGPCNRIHRDGTLGYRRRNGSDFQGRLRGPHGLHQRFRRPWRAAKLGRRKRTAVLGLSARDRPDARPILRDFDRAFTRLWDSVPAA